VFVCVVFPTVLVVQQIRHNPSLSPADEFAHLDYVAKLAEGKLPRTGELVEPRILRIEACAGIATVPPQDMPRCGTRDLRPERFPNNGFNHEAQQPPFYYAVTAGARAAAERILGPVDFLASARATNLLWLVPALLMLWAAGRLLGARPLALLAALLLLVVSPAVIYYSSIVSNDATVLFAGALVFLAAVVVGLRPRVPGMILLAVSAVVAVGLKPTNAFAAATVACFAFALLWRQDGRCDRAMLITWMRSGGVLLTASVVVAGGWGAVANALALVDARTLPIYAVRPMPDLHLDVLLSEATTLLAPATGTLPAGTLTRPIQTFTSELIRALFLLAGGAALFSRRRDWFHLLGAAALAVLLAGGFAYGFVVWVTLRMDPGTGSRYGLSVLPVLAVALAFLAERGRVVWLVGAVGVVTAVTTLSVFV
jgi:hypothetical protein